MTLPSIKLPEDSSDLPGWIEQHLLDSQLPDVVVQLECLLDSTTSTESLSQILGGQEQQVLAIGLSALPNNALNQLIANPQLLYELQELVLIEGGEYWQRQLPPANDQQWQSVRHRIQSTSAATVTSQETPGSSRRSWIYAAIAIAAVLLIALFPRDNGPGWGFDKPGMLTQNVPEAEMLALLADSANAWFNKTPTDAASLRKRLIAFDRGCQTLLAADLPQLPPETREAVFAACRDCRQAITTHLTSLQNGDEYKVVLGAANQTVRDLVNELRRA